MEETGSTPFGERPQFPRTSRLGSVFSSWQPITSAPVENGYCHLPRCCTGHHDAGSDPWTTYPLLEFCAVQSRLQCLCGGAFDLGGHALNHPCSARMARTTN